MSPDASPQPYGSWPSPITAARLVEGAAGVSEARVDGDDVWWNEQRPSEGGRYQLVRRSPDGTRHDLFAPFDPSAAAPTRNWNARTAVLEYGGGAWNVRHGVVVFADWADQRLHRVAPGSAPVPVTPEPTVDRGLRWSEPTWLDDHWLICVRESHEPDAVERNGEAVNEIVAVPIDGSAVEDPSSVRVLVSGPDFVHSPAVHGDTVAWLQWDHPAMPWDATELVVGVIERDEHGAPTGVTARAVVAGGPGESVVQPGFVAPGDLLFCSDRSGWWNPWRLPGAVREGPGRAEPVIAGDGVEAEIGGGLWVGGLRWWTRLDDDRVVVSATSDGATGLAVITPDGSYTDLSTPFTEVSQVVAGPTSGSVVVVAGTPTSETGPYLVTLPDGIGAGPVEIEPLRPARDLGIDETWFSRPRHVSFPSAGGRTAHALFYPPANPQVTVDSDERPPLVVMIHGGPTSAARHRLDLAKQFWTSRGFAVVDVNYGGSTGYGRPYRDLLQGGWGVIDLEDAVAAAEHLAGEGLVDAERLAIRGGSAGGYTTLAALCFHDTFRAGASHYGIADLAVLATETHKFESRYLDGLVGPWPEARHVYEARSPIHHTDGFDRPLIVLQGSEDEVVPPNQAELIVDALDRRGVPHAYLLFEGEQHGFRRAENIIRALEAELWFYGRVFDFVPADPVEPVPGAVGL